MTPVPKQMMNLPVQDGRPVPWFAAVDPANGAYDFRVMDADKFRRAIRFRLCWVCGGRLGAHTTFVIGPMCAVNRVSAEPPAHTACAEWSAQNCPFLIRPSKERRETDLPDGTSDPAGYMLTRNPGVTLLWTSKNWRPFQVEGGWLFDVGDPTAHRWMREGRPATRDEVNESIMSGLPVLTEGAATMGRRALAELERQVARAMLLLPEADRG